MRRLILALATFIFCSLWAEVRVEKVLETTSIKEYNQWVKKNKAKYPGLKPYYLKTECIKWGKEWKIYYYNEEGNLWKEELLKAKPGSDIYVRDYPYIGRIVISQDDSILGACSDFIVTAKDNQGKQTYSFITGPYTVNIPEFGFIAPNWERRCISFIDWYGNNIGQIDDVDVMNFYVDALSIAPDRRKITISYSFGTSRHYVILIDNGKVRWQKEFSSALELSMSDDGQYVCIGDAGKIFVYDNNGDSLYSFCFSPEGMYNPYSDFSQNNKYLVAAVTTELVLIDNTTGKLLWQKKVEGDAYKRGVWFAKNDECIIITHISAAKTYVFDLEGNLLTTIEAPNLYCDIVDDLIILNAERDKFHPTIYRLK
ncbi:MAG: hypothetical protein ACUVQT_10905 [bacterium]